MIQSKSSRVSIVIPVYNEAAHLAACLQAIAAQTVTPYEVLVVDNNSTDESAAVAARFDFVTLLREPRQGVVHARNRGFEAARGALIARIDADTILPAHWIAQVQAIFRASDVAAISGAPHYYDFPLPALADAIDHPLRSRLARKLRNTNFLWGANMAIRRTAWQQVRDALCSDNHMHEDFDLAIHLQEQGLQVCYDARLTASVSSRRIDSRFLAFVRYTLVSPRTYALHGLRSRYHMYPTLVVCWLCYLPARVIYRAYDPETQSYSLTQLLAAGSSRVDPTTNIV
ncbi:MAG TPA: glycosyltransferase family A protein [Candidatus Saccharimonadales bacterium]|nr:glycosyltransferase family A protein [Candidatus Saccharimonadales bacterium]